MDILLTSPVQDHIFIHTGKTISRSGNTVFPDKQITKFILSKNFQNSEVKTKQNLCYLGDNQRKVFLSHFF